MDKNSGALRGGFLRMKAQQDNTIKDFVFTFAGGLIKALINFKYLLGNPNYARRLVSLGSPNYVWEFQKL